MAFFISTNKDWVPWWQVGAELLILYAIKSLDVVGQHFIPSYPI